MLLRGRSLEGDMVGEKLSAGLSMARKLAEEAAAGT
jgi:hypothetical protein